MRSPLSQSQLGIYYACVTSVSGECNYQNPVLFSLPDSVDIRRLQEAVYGALCAHSYLAGHIVLNDDGEPVYESGTFSTMEECVPVSEITSINEVSHTFSQTMDIYSERLCRCEIYLTPSQNYLYMDIHHVLADGFTITIILREIERLYAGKKAAGEMLDGVAIAEAEEAQRKDTALMDEAREWYANNFYDAAETDSLPIPEQRSNEQEKIVYRHYPLTVSKEDIQVIMHRFDVRESTIMQAAFGLLLATYSAEDKASWCTAYFGRSDRRTLTSATMMVHTLPVFMRTSADMTVLQMLCALREQMESTQHYRYYAYQDAVRDIALNNQVMFVYQGAVLADKRSLHLDGNLVPYTDLRQLTPGWKLCVELFGIEEGYSLKAGYSNADYSDGFMQELAECYSTILHSMVQAEYVRDLECSSPKQREWLDGQNPTIKKTPLTEGKTLVSLFKKHVAEQPNAICCVAGDRRLTYEEVDRLSDTLDPQYVILCGERVIGYTVPRNEQMVIVPLAIAKAGMTAMPLDGSYPAERLEYMKADAAKYNGTDAFILLYTSGTTGTPKGVMLSERNLIALLDYHVPYIGLTNESRYASYAGYGFDAYMHDLWGCIYAGAAIHIISDDIRFDMAALYDYFCREHITHIFMTTQVATQLVIDYPDIPGLEYLGTGGEKLMTVNPPSYKFLNAYGPTETTCYVCSYWVDKKETNIPIGYPTANAELFVVNKYGKRVPWGAAGELLITGEQVGLGYLNQPERTKEAFVEWNGMRCYRTGDIVRYRSDGAIEFVGRKDGQVKIRGFRIELKEVEAVIRQFSGIEDATVQAFDAPAGGKFIAAYIVSKETIDIHALKSFILEQKPPYMVPAAIMQIPAIPLNQNQKVNRRALPDPVMTGDDMKEECAAPLNILEEELKRMAADIVGSDNFGITTDLRETGLTSISSISLATKVYKRFGVSLDAKQMVHGLTIQAIENEILKSLLSGGSDAGKQQSIDSLTAQLESSGPFPLSHAQTGVYFDCMKNPTSTIYNIPMRARMPEGVTAEQLQHAVEQVVANHPELHVCFATNEKGVVQEIVANYELQITIRTLSEDRIDSYKEEFVRPFNLNKDMLCRFAIVQTEQALYLYSDMHHLVCDGASYDIFFNELCALLEGNPIEPELCSYAQFVADEKDAETGEEFAEAKSFFHSRLSEIEGVTELPPDLTNPLPQGEIRHVYAPMDFAAAEHLAHEAGITPASVTLAAVFYTLSRFANNEQICITTISNGRSKLQMAETMGMFVNTLALSAKIGKQSVLDFIKETGVQFAETLTHEYYPFVQIAADYDLTAEIMFAYQIGVLREYTVHGQTLQLENMELNIPKFPIAFYIMEVDGRPSVTIEYDNGRYSREMMQSLAQSVSNAVSAFAVQPQAALRSISLLNDAQTEILDSFNKTAIPYDDTQTIVSLFRKQADSTPDNIAVVYQDKRYTYKQVDELSDRIAAGLHPTTNVIAIKVQRSEWMVIAALSVLKTGCAYLPLDPSYPEERLNFMQQDANSCILLTEKELVELTRCQNSGTKEFAKSKPSDLFILLYTSGSTGVPKGVMLEHGNLVAFCHWYHRYYDLHEGDKVAAYASYGFDANMMDMYPALTCGATVYIIPEDMRLNLPELGKYFDTEGITHSFMTTQIGYQFATNIKCHSLKHLSVGGEALSALNPPDGYKMYNGYGPTECTIFTTTYCLGEYEQHIPIGKPLDNLQLFIMDTDCQRLPLGATGELWVSGPQVSRGYLNQPEKTAETFVEKGGIRFYRTGDIVRYLPDGNIQFVGRRDGQVKIRGFRIELKEVETVIRQFSDVKDATVQAFEYANGGKYIAAYIVSDKTIDINALHAFIRERKPPYMVPAATMQIDFIPLNQNQKVNKKALPTPVFSSGEGISGYVEPSTPTEHLFADIFAHVLNLDKVGATDNFFELGGTSLMVTQVIIEADKAGKHIAYADLFAHPTPRDLTRLVEGSHEQDSEPDVDHEIADFDYTDISHILQRNTLETYIHGERQTLGNVLLTGATGYLGIHVLRELIESEAKTITCLVRGKSKEDSERRLKNLLFYYFNQRFDELFGTRLLVINGDVTSEIHADNINTVFNCAANVKHFSKGTDIEDVNIGGAQRCVDFCLATGASLVHVSTTSTGGVWVGNDEPDPLLTEQTIYFGQYLGNQYMHSKFLADRLILEAVAHKGLKAKIMRVGNLAARSYDGEFQVNFSTNSYMGRIKIFNMLGCCPFEQYDQPTEFSPIDETARAIVLLAQTPDGCTVFHPYNTHTRLLGDVLAGLENVGTRIRFVEQQEFVMNMQQAAQDSEKASMLTTMLAYKDMAHGKPAHVVKRDNEYTSQVLLRLGFRWSEPDTNYINRMLIAIGQLGFFD